MRFGIGKIIRRPYLDENNKAHIGNFVVAGKSPFHNRWYYLKLDNDLGIADKTLYIQTYCDYGHFMYMRRY